MAGPPRREANPDRPRKAYTRPRTGTDEKAKTSPDVRAKRTSKSRNRSPERSPPKAHRVSKHTSYSSSGTERSSNVLSIDSLAKLDALNEKVTVTTKERERKVEKKREKEKIVTGRVVKERGKHRRKSDGREKRRVVSGPLAEEGGVTRRRGGYVEEDSGKKRFGRKFWWGVGVLVLLLAIIIPVAIVVSKNKSSGGGGSGSNGGGGGDSTQGGDPPNTNLKGVDQNSIPTASKNTILDPFIWYDTTDFNLTYTNQTVGGLPVMGLNSTWDDTIKANQYVPALNESFAYGTMPIRGVNLGGWLSIEPFITPSLFNTYQPNQNIVDEWSLTKQLGVTDAAKVLEKHYALFINEQSFKDIQAAGFDHVRIPYSYWAVTTYPGDPYVPKISWRYLLRGIEYARKCGIRVNLDLHALPGSQNGWNHSGRQGNIGWLKGTDGSLNGQRSLDLHNQLSTFFAQPRYKNVVTIYGLANEPKMTQLQVSDVITWTTTAVQNIRKNGMQQTIAFGDGFLGLGKWHGQLQGVQGLVLDAHQYVIFNKDQIAYTHQKKIQFACDGWSGQMKASVDTSTGYVCSITIPFRSNPSIDSVPPSVANGPKPTPTAPPTSITSTSAPAGPAH